MSDDFWEHIETLQNAYGISTNYTRVQYVKVAIRDR